MKFIVFEGIDGAGKSTLMRALSNFLNNENQEHILTREPGGTPLAEEIRSLVIDNREDAPVPRCELLLYEASRAQHVDAHIKPAIERGNWVLCDRFTASSVAFQNAGRGVGTENTKWLNDFATGGFYPDLSVLVDLPVDEGQKRILQRDEGMDRMETERAEFHNRVRKSFLEQSAAEANWLVLDGTLPKETLSKQLIDHVMSLKWI